MRLASVRRIASHLLKCGEARVRVLDAREAAKALTRDDVRSLIARGLVVKILERGVGRAKAQLRHERRLAGRGRGPGKKKGTAYAVLARKKRWIQLVRSQRRLLEKMRGTLVRGAYARLYAMVRGGVFADKRHLKLFAQEHKLVKKS